MYRTVRCATQAGCRGRGRVESDMWGKPSRVSRRALTRGGVPVCACALLQVMVYPVTTTASGDSDVASSIGVDEDDAHGHTETMVGWADVRELLRAFVVTHANKLALVTGVHAWDSALDAVASDFVRRKLVSVCGDDGQLLPQADTDTMTLLTAVTEGFLSTGGEERTLTPRSAAQCNASSQHLSNNATVAPLGDWTSSEGHGGGGGGAGTFGAEQRSTQGGGAVVHRVALFRGGHICGILSQSDVMAYLWRHHAELLPPRLASTSLPELGFATGRRVVCVTPTTPAHAAFTTMFSYNVSGVGVVDANERLVANLSASDLRRLQPDNFRVLSLPLDAFLDEMQAPGRHPVTVAPSATLLEVVRLLGGGGGTGRLHRVYICDAGGRPVGVITATDVLRMLVRLETEG